MNKFPPLTSIAPLFRVVLGTIWIVAGTTKLGKIASTTQSIEAYQIFSFEWARFLATIIGPTEIVGGMLLVLGVFVRACSAVSLVVLVLFVTGHVQALIRGLSIDCGCFGTGGVAENRSAMYVAIFRDVALITMNTYVWKSPNSKRFSLESWVT